MRVDSLVLVFDRHVEKPDDGLPWQERERLRMRLTRQLAEIDTQLRELGLEPLEDCIELSLGLGIARHDPAIASAAIERLLAAETAKLDGGTREALARLGARLDVASEQGAKFCLWPMSGWTGLIETNLHLYIGG